MPQPSSSIAVNQGGPRYTLEQIKPHLRVELDRRIVEMAVRSADRVGENRKVVIEDTLLRFADWITARPADAQLLRPASELAPPKAPEALARLPFDERLRQVVLHQGTEFPALLNEMLAIDGGALAMVWRTGLCADGNDSLDHRVRDGKCYALRDSWAMKRGLMQVGESGFYDQITSVSREHYCRCSANWIYNLRSLPSDLITPKGEAELVRVRAEIERLKNS